MGSDNDANASAVPRVMRDTRRCQMNVKMTNNQYGTKKM